MTVTDSIVEMCIYERRHRAVKVRENVRRMITSWNELGQRVIDTAQSGNDAVVLCCGSEWTRRASPVNYCIELGPLLCFQVNIMTLHRQTQ